jgi:hypothetical protein
MPGKRKSKEALVWLDGIEGPMTERMMSKNCVCVCLISTSQWVDVALTLDLAALFTEEFGGGIEEVSINDQSFSAEIFQSRNCPTSILNSKEVLRVRFCSIRDSERSKSDRINGVEMFHDGAVWWTILSCEGTLAHFDQASYLLAIDNMTRSVAPEYGFGFERASSMGPMLYSVGVPSTVGANDEEWAAVHRDTPAIVRWSNDVGNGKSNRFRRGLMRDVYPLNILSDKHLSNAIDGQTLKDWITTGGRGILRPMSGSMFSWQLSSDELPKCRDACIEACLVIGQ